MTPEQRRRNRKTGLILLAIVLAIFAWTIYRGPGMLGSVAGLTGR
jgi:hypothetical protein